MYKEKTDGAKLFDYYCDWVSSVKKAGKVNRTIKNSAIFKKLVEEHGLADSMSYVGQCFERWEELQDQFDIYSIVPTPGILTAYYLSFTGYFDRKRKRKNSVEYEKASAGQRNSASTGKKFIS